MGEREILPHDGAWRGETYQFRLRLPKGRKDYVCHACDELIPKGTVHVAIITVNVEGPGMETWRIHGECYLEPGMSLLNGERRPEWRWGHADV